MAAVIIDNLNAEASSGVKSSIIKEIRAEQRLLLLNSLLFLVDLIATFAALDINDIYLHFKMHLIEVPLQIVSYYLIYYSSK